MKIPDFTQDGVIVQHERGSIIINGRRHRAQWWSASGERKGITFGSSIFVECSLDEMYALKGFLRQHLANWILWVNRPTGVDDLKGNSLTEAEINSLLLWEALTAEDRQIINTLKVLKFQEDEDTFPFSPDETCIYLMRDGATGYTKIGRSVKPEFREKTLLAQAPTVTLVGYWTKCQKSHESELHQLFADKRVRGEWFNLLDADYVIIQEFFQERGNDYIECCQGDG